ncbi:homeodomain-interacting protein kinase 2-like [Gadus macrocephalus]|uniref:homeodomain-interacting protein kinase 2-like n=1 Tax=Gadus macrocephalus TaxID=80720 RepID=UPI0028CBAFB3|nr:homeodomain-interacting protein kinase 2-like [Gadus macrocephalus]
MINDRFMIASAKQEIAILERLQVLDPDECGIVRWMGVFRHGPRICLEFELLDRSLRDLTQQTEHHILPLMQIKIILQQLARALQYLGTIGIIHADLKPENIMLTEQDTRVKLIDFGISYHVSKATIGLEIQTMFYRSPEVILGLPFTGMVDMWSLGCVVAELFIGFPIYPGNMEYDMLRYILETNGNLPVAMLDRGMKTHLFFNKGSIWRLKSARQYEERESLRAPRTRRFLISSLEGMVELGAVLGGPVPPSFTDLMKRMLRLDANQRITPRALLEHPFISLGGENQSNGGSPEPTVDPPDTSSPVSSVDPPRRKRSRVQCGPPDTSAPVSSVGPPDNGTPVSSVGLPDTVSPGSGLDPPNSSSPGPSVEPPERSNPVSTVDPPKSYCPEGSGDVEDTVDPTDSGKGSFSEGEIRDIYNLSLDSEIVRFTPTLKSLCDLNESAEELRIEENPATAEIHSTSSAPTTSCVVAMETDAGQPGVADIPIEVTQKNMNKRGLVKRLFKSMPEAIIYCCVCCCCPAPDDQD